MENDIVVGTLTLLTLPALSNRGSWHGQIEAVRIAGDRRGQGFGAAFVEWAVALAKGAGCGSVQLVSDASRVDAHRFWQRCGFTASHRGFKRLL